MNAKHLLAAVAALVTLTAHAEVVVKNAWIRGIAPGQSATGAFMELTSATPTALVGVATPAAKVSEIHTMSMDNGVMRMRAIASLPLAAGQTVALKPGGYHVMLLELKQPLAAGERVPVSLTFERADGQRETVEVQATVRALGAAHKMH